MKHAVLLLWHKDFEQLIHLISLFTSNFRFYIHLDKKVKLSKDDLSKLSGIEQVEAVFQKYKVNWGGINVLKTQLFLLGIIAKNKSISYIHFLSCQDYLACHPTQIDSFFVKNRGLEYISHEKLPYEKWENGTYNRFDYFGFYDWFDCQRSHGFKVIDLCIKIQINCGFKRNIPNQYSNLYGGSTLMSITRECGEYIVDNLRTNRPLFSRLKHTWAPEETYFPTIIMNSPFAQRVINDNKRYINWDFKNNRFPAILDEQNFVGILLAESLFIHKIDLSKSKRLIELIHQYLLQKEEVQISKEGFWKHSSLAGHCFDKKLAEGILDVLRYANIQTIADFGCGPGWYVAYLRQHGYDVEGYDGNPFTPQLSAHLFTDGFYCQQMDLTEPVEAEEPFDMILCLEVGEHLPAEYEEVLFENLARNAKKYVLLSWAVEGQHGDGHINCKPNSYIIAQIEKYGFAFSSPVSNYLRCKASRHWFWSTLMFFEKKKRD